MPKRVERVERAEKNRMLIEPDMNEEIWKDIEDWEGLYQVSNMSRVRGLDRVMTGKNGVTQHRTGIVLRPRLSSTLRYAQVLLSSPARTKAVLVHILVAKAFIPNPENKPNIDHKNGNPEDNRICNLRWCTVRENMGNSKKRKGTSSRYKGVQRSRWKILSWVAQIKVNGVTEYLGTYKNEEEAAKAYDEAALRVFGEFARLNLSNAN